MPTPSDPQLCQRTLECCHLVEPGADSLKIGCTYQAQVVSLPYLRKLAHRQVIEALSTRSSSAALLGYLALITFLPGLIFPLSQALAPLV